MSADSNNTKVRQIVDDFYNLNNIKTYDDFESGLADEQKWPTPASIQEALDCLHPEVIKRYAYAWDIFPKYYVRFFIFNFYIK